jgi:hypothetical protein
MEKDEAGDKQEWREVIVSSFRNNFTQKKIQRKYHYQVVVIPRNSRENQTQ